MATSSTAPNSNNYYLLEGLSSTPVSYSSAQLVPPNSTNNNVNTWYSDPTATSYPNRSINNNPTQTYSAPQTQAPQAPTVGQPDYGAIDSAYNQSNDYLNNLYNETANSKDSFINQYTAPYEAQRPLLEQARTSGLAQTETQKGQARVQAENVLDEARRLYSELTKSGTQRFGGANSAGQFYQGYLGKELLRQQGGVENQLGSNLQAISQKQQEIESGYQAGIQKLQTELAGVKSQAENLFMQKLQQINGMRNELNQNKAQLKLQALQDYRNTINSYQQQAYTLQNQLYAQAQQAAMNLRSAYDQYATQAQQGATQGAYTPPSYYTPTATTSTQTVAPTGYVNYNKKTTQ